MKRIDMNDRTALGVGISLIITTVTIFAAVVYAGYKIFSTLNKLSRALDLYIDEHELYTDDDDDDYYDDDEGYISCECCGDEDESEETT